MCISEKKLYILGKILCISETILCSFRGKYSVFEEYFVHNIWKYFLHFKKTFDVIQEIFCAFQKLFDVIQETCGALLKKDFVYLRKHLLHFFKKDFLHFLEKDFVEYRKDSVYFNKHFVYFGKHILHLSATVGK